MAVAFVHRADVLTVRRELEYDVYLLRVSDCMPVKYDGPSFLNNKDTLLESEPHVSKMDTVWSPH